MSACRVMEKGTLNELQVCVTHVAGVVPSCRESSQADLITFPLPLTAGVVH